MCGICGCGTPPRRGRVRVEYYKGNCICCLEPRKQLYSLVESKYGDKVEIKERNFGESLDVASEALEKGIWGCSTFVIGDEKISDVSKLDKRLEQLLGL